MNLVLVTAKSVRLRCGVICLDSCFHRLISLVPEMSECSYQTSLLFGLCWGEGYGGKGSVNLCNLGFKGWKITLALYNSETRFSSGVAGNTILVIVQGGSAKTFSHEFSNSSLWVAWRPGWISTHLSMFCFPGDASKSHAWKGHTG